jgi:hypothetical protein
MKRKTVVSSEINGDTISISYVECPVVTAKNVVVGRGCKIGIVRYGEEIKISKGAKVGKIEKIY